MPYNFRTRRPTNKNGVIEISDTPSGSSHGRSAPVTPRKKQRRSKRLNRTRRARITDSEEEPEDRVDKKPKFLTKISIYNFKIHLTFYMNSFTSTK